MPLLQDRRSDKKVFFAHPPRTGGRTVEAMFVAGNAWKSTLTSMYLPLWWTNEVAEQRFQNKPECSYYKGIELSHLCYDKYRDFIDPSVVPSFMVCRNPITRFQSYVYYENVPGPLNTKNLVETVEGRKTLMDSWNEQNVFINPQYKFCNQHMKIWKFEDGFGPEFIEWVNKEFNFNLIFSPTRNAHSRFDTQFKRKPLHPELIDFLKDAYKWDFDYFGYSLG